ncbi:unnamed protein product [Withania somnifera]
MAGTVSIPTIDLSSFLLGEKEESKKEVTEKIKQACSEYGLFQVINHGVPLNLINQTMELCKEFFHLPYEDKLKFYNDKSDAPLTLPHGYSKHKADKNEYLCMCSPGSTTNVYPPNIQPVMENLFNKFSGTCQLLEGILNDCLGLPPNFFRDYNDDRCLDILLSFRYFPATESENDGAASHQDPTVLSLIFQDNAGGLEVLIDKEWVPIAPMEGALVFHISDVLQVLTNDKFMSPFHKVVRPKGKSRYVFVFFYNLSGEKWVEPLPQFTKDIGELPKYKRFQFKDYFGMRVTEKLNPPAKHEHKTTLATFASAT